MVGSDGLDGGPPPTSPGRSHKFEVTMAHKLKFWKEGHARRKLGNSSQSARARDCDCLPRLSFFFSFFCTGQSGGKVAIRIFFFFFAGASTQSDDDDDMTVVGAIVALSLPFPAAHGLAGWLDENDARRRCIEDQYMTLSCRNRKSN